MNSLPLNNLDMHLLRFNNTKRDSMVSLKRSKRVFTFKKPIIGRVVNKPESRLNIRTYDTSGRVTSTPKSSIAPKLQSSILSFVKNKSNAVGDSITDSGLECDTSRENVSNPNIFVIDDLDDFEIPQKRNHPVNSKLPADRLKNETSQPFRSNDIPSSQMELPDLVTCTNSDSQEKNVNYIARCESPSDEMQSTAVTISSSNKNEILTCSNEQENFDIPEQNSEETCIPETQCPDYSQLFPTDDEDLICTQKINDLKLNSTDKYQINEVITNHDKDVNDSLFHHELKEANLVVTTLPDFNAANEENKDILHPMSPLKEINYSIMTKICDMLISNTSIISNIPGLKELLEVRSQLLTEINPLQQTETSEKPVKKLSLSSRLACKYQENSAGVVNNTYMKSICNTTAFSSKTETSQEYESIPLQTAKNSIASSVQPALYSNAEESNLQLNDIQSPVISSNIDINSNCKAKRDNRLVSLSNISDLCSTNKSFGDYYENTDYINITSQEYDNYNDSLMVVGLKDDLGKQNNISANAETTDIRNLSLNTHLRNEPEKEIDYTSALYQTQANKTNFMHNETKSMSGCFYRNHRDDGSSNQFKGTNFPHSQEMLTIFRQVFGLFKFRHNQLESINAALLGKDCFVLMPTGGGKSLCYQLPALITKGVTIVISPLRSLIQDQVQKLWSLDIPANHLSGEMDTGTADVIYRQLVSREPGIKLLYVTPEKISASNKLTHVFQNLFKRNMLSRFVIDEAHCVSQWGHDFRPDYKRLKILREKYPNVPLMALTATATPRVRTDVLHQLNMSKPKWFIQSFNRPNLKYEVCNKKGKSCIQDIITLIHSKFSGMSGIVYCLSRNDCDQVARDFNAAGILAISYHAGMDNESRNHAQELWINDKAKVVCATIAFGMGIDKPDVRFVIHHSLPKSIEGYYQESGRAGRDGEKSWCFLYYNYHDVLRIRRMIESDFQNQHAIQMHKDNLYHMVAYCENRGECRRVQMLEYFGEIFKKEQCLSRPLTACDNCLSKQSYETCDVTEDAISIVQCVTQLVGNVRRKNYTLLYFTDIFKGYNNNKITSAGHNKLPLHGRGQAYQRAEAERLLRKLVLDGFLEEDLVVNQMDHAVTYVKLGHRASELLNGKAKVIFQLKKGSKHSLSVQPIVEIDDNSEIKQLSDRCYAELIEVSKSIASKRGIHYTNVINVEALRQMSREMPMTESEMLQIPHVTRVIYEKYGQYFLDVTQKYGSERIIIDAEQENHTGFDSFGIIDDDNGWLNCQTGDYQIGKKGKRRKANTKSSGSAAKKNKASKFKMKWARNKGKPHLSKLRRQKSTTSNNSNRTELKSMKNNQGFNLGLLPVPQPQKKPLQMNAQSRSFLPPPKVYKV